MAVFTGYPGVNNDDGECHMNGSLNFAGYGGTYMMFGWAGYSVHMFLRFPSVTCALGELISNASLRMFQHIAMGSSGTVQIKGIKQSNPATASSQAELTARPLTTASLTQEYSGATGYKTSGDLTPIIQELVNQPGWANNNAMMLFLDYQGGDSGYFRNYEYGSTRPELTFTHINDLGSTYPQLRSRNIRQSIQSSLH